MSEDKSLLDEADYAAMNEALAREINQTIIDDMTATIEGGRPLSSMDGARIWRGNLIIPCQGAHQCAGNIRIPFQPTIEGTFPERAEGSPVWKREGGTTLDDITLSPSIDAGECGHFHIQNGRVVDA